MFMSTLAGVKNLFVREMTGLPSITDGLISMVLPGTFWEYRVP
jgi:hypothetical protein